MSDEVDLEKICWPTLDQLRDVVRDLTSCAFRDPRATPEEGVFAGLEHGLYTAVQISREVAKLHENALREVSPAAREVKDAHVVAVTRSVQRALSRFEQLVHHAANVERAVRSGAPPVRPLQALDEPVLCYVSDRWAWFTTCPLAAQRGDGWGVVPYGGDAGPPYKWHSHMGKDVAPYALTLAAFEARLVAPCDDGRRRSLDLSVYAINAGKAPWLTSSDPTRPGPQVEIYAGATLPEFVAKVRAAGGRVFTEAT